jgi:hypothetical protein
VTITIKVTEGELKVLDWIFMSLMRGALGTGGQTVTRRPEFSSLVRKIQALKESVRANAPPK